MNINNSAYFNYLITYLIILRKNKKKDTWVWWSDQASTILWWSLFYSIQMRKDIKILGAAQCFLTQTN